MDAQFQLPAHAHQSNNQQLQQIETLLSKYDVFCDGMRDCLIQPLRERLESESDLVICVGECTVMNTDSIYIDEVENLDDEEGLITGHLHPLRCSPGSAGLCGKKVPFLASRIPGEPWAIYLLTS